MQVITLQMLKDMQPGIFKSGEFLYDGGIKKWVAVRGGYWDWAIYYDLPYKSEPEIASMGAKLHEMPIVKELVNCDELAFEMYRR
jgi:hypothetical protein